MLPSEENDLGAPLLVPPVVVPAPVSAAAEEAIVVAEDRGEAVAARPSDVAARRPRQLEAIAEEGGDPVRRVAPRLQDTVSASSASGQMPVPPALTLEDSAHGEVRGPPSAGSTAIDQPAKKARALFTAVDLLVAEWAQSLRVAGACVPSFAFVSASEDYLGPPVSARVLDELSKVVGTRRLGDCFVNTYQGSGESITKKLASNSFDRTYHRTSAIKPRKHQDWMILERSGPGAPLPDPEDLLAMASMGSGKHDWMGLESLWVMDVRLSTSIRGGFVFWSVAVLGNDHLWHWAERHETVGTETSNDLTNLAVVEADSVIIVLQPPNKAPAGTLVSILHPLGRPDSSVFPLSFASSFSPFVCPLRWENLTTS